MKLEINEDDDLVIRNAEEAKLQYALSIADNLINSKDSNKISSDLDRIWRICGFPSKKKFDKLFKQYKGITISEYCKKLNPKCKC